MLERCMEIQDRWERKIQRLGVVIQATFSWSVTKRVATEKTDPEESKILKQREKEIKELKEAGHRPFSDSNKADINHNVTQPDDRPTLEEQSPSSPRIIHEQQ